ncbi:MAG TPA: hypothetical protein VFI47_20640 [Acidimicrobiales bacterium]|nr:hypothetical protein [Acidimicrobiales bacterium]
MTASGSPGHVQPWLDALLGAASPWWAVPIGLLGLAVGWAARGPLARATGMPRAAAVAYVATLGVMLALTLSPRWPHGDYVVWPSPPGRCRVVPSPFTLRQPSGDAEWVLNLVLLAPAGWAARSAARGGRRALLLAGAAAVPVVVEAAQYAIAAIERMCEGRDAVSNWLGLALGYGAAAAAHLHLRRRRARPDRTPPPVEPAPVEVRSGG